jgi:hypothetical protein
MKIFIQSGGQESGPYTKSEVFALLKNGSITSDALGRWENETDWKPINQVLSSGNLGLFSAEQIAQKQEELPETPVLIPDFIPTRSEQPAQPITQPNKSKRPLVLACAALVLAGCSIATLVHISHQPEEQENPIANTIPAPPESTVASRETPQPHLPVAELAAASPEQSAEPSPPAPQEEVKLSTPEETPAPTDTLAEVQPTPEESAPSFFGKPAGSATEVQTTEATAEATPAVEPITTPALVAEFSEKTQNILFPQIPGVEAASVNITQLEQNPRGILLIYLDRRDRGDLVFADEAWKDFARSHNLLLAVTKFDFSDNGAIGNIQKALLQKLEPWKGLPILAYGRHSGGWLVSAFANMQEPRISSWAVLTNGHLMSQIQKDSRPALLICDYEITKDNPDLRKFFEDGRALGKRWTWLSLANPVDQRQAKAEEFVRSYFHELLDQSSVKNHWADIDDLIALPDSYAMGYPKTTVWLPSDELASQWKNLMPTPEQKAEPTIVRKKIKTNCKAQPELELVLRLPPGTSKEHPPAGTFAFCTWDASADQIAEKLRYKPDLKSVATGGPVWVANNIIKYADDHNFAVLSWETRQVWSLQGNTEDLSRQQQREFDMNFDKLAAAWETGVKLLESGYQMPSKDMLLYGISRGAQWAHRLALRKPEHFLAIHVHIPSTFDAPTQKANTLLWLVTTGERESGYEKAIRFYKECRKLNYPILFKAIMGLGHHDDSLSWNLDHRFFEYALQLREERRKIAKDQNLDMLSTAPLSQSWLKSYFNSPYVADLLNQEIFPRSEAEMVPPGFQVLIPTEQIAEIWGSDVPHRQFIAK